MTRWALGTKTTRSSVRRRKPPRSSATSKRRWGVPRSRRPPSTCTERSGRRSGLPITAPVLVSVALRCFKSGREAQILEIRSFTLKISNLVRKSLNFAQLLGNRGLKKRDFWTNSSTRYTVLGRGAKRRTSSVLPRRIPQMSQRQKTSVRGKLAKRCRTRADLEEHCFCTHLAKKAPNGCRKRVPEPADTSS